MVLEPKKSTKIGTTSVGKNFYFLLGILFSTLFNVSGIGALLDNVVSWVGAFAIIVDAYKAIIIDPISYFIADFFGTFGITMKPPRLITAYYTITSGLSVTYMFLTQLLGRKIENTDSYAMLAKASPISITKSILSNQKPTWVTLTLTALLVPPYSLFLLILTVTMFPIFLIRQTSITIHAYFNLDFSNPPKKKKERHLFDRAYLIYNTTVTFWSVLLITICLLAFCVLLNKELTKKCTENSNPSIFCRSAPAP